MKTSRIAHPGGWIAPEHAADGAARVDIVSVAGRAAELLVLGQSSTGTAQELAEATEIVARMVREYGFSSRFGPRPYVRRGTSETESAFERRLLRRGDAADHRREVARLLPQAEERAIELLDDYTRALDQLSQQLLTEETVDGSAVYDILRNEGSRVA